MYIYIYIYLVVEAFVVNNNYGCILCAYIICLRLCIGITNRLNINNNPIKVTNQIIQ